MKKFKHGRAAVEYGEECGIVDFEPTDSVAGKIEYIYRLLVHDKLISPLPEEQVSQQTMRVARQLPKDHPLLK